MLTFKEKQKTLFVRQKHLLNHQTNAEKAFAAKLDALKIRNLPQKGFIKDRGYAIVDFYIPNKRICIEIDGGYHNTKEQKVKDAFKNEYLQKDRGFRLIRMSNDHAFEISLAGLKRLLA